MVQTNKKKNFATLERKLDNNESAFCFIGAPGGTGKAFILNLLQGKMLKDRMLPYVTARSGITATLLWPGQTAHTDFGLPIDVFSHNTSKITPKSQRRHPNVHKL